jgi:hypothetical protein
MLANVSRFTEFFSSRFRIFHGPFLSIRPAVENSCARFAIPWPHLVKVL